MSRPVVALVGRPNVGKSTLFNRLAEERLAVVDDIPGTTRDRLSADADWAGVNFTLSIPAASIQASPGAVVGRSPCPLAQPSLSTRSALRLRSPSGMRMPSCSSPMPRAV